MKVNAVVGDILLLHLLTKHSLEINVVCVCVKL